ncbi:MAG: uroporphyrinogen-III C-methyltransferase [Alicyclobacillus sp.]|nr:uroporphyrinogen-III C-methyltransferase [Alicyclobacillus sp.]
MAIGRVFLVGAGPGDPGLLTVKAKRCLEQADAVVYDRLVSPRLLGYVPPGADLYDVGKTAESGTGSQTAIHRLLVELALCGKTVVRLKGGDPFVFGRGSEEAAFLTAHAIPWQVVPGVSSAIAAPAYAGIPVTQRAVSPSFTVVTGHRCAGEEAPNWSALAAQGGTLVILMGVRPLRRIVAQLLAGGMSPDTPIALIHWGTRANQETLVGTLADIVERVHAAGFQSPACIVVGRVVDARAVLQWVESQPRFGQRWVVAAETRVDAEAQAVTLEQLGAETIALAAQDVLELHQAALVEAVQASARTAAVWAFHTALGVAQFFSTWRAASLDVRRLANLRFVACSAAAGAALRREGIQPDWTLEPHPPTGQPRDLPLVATAPVYSDAPEGRDVRSDAHPMPQVGPSSQVTVLPWRPLAEGRARALDARTREWISEGFDGIWAQTPWAEVVIRRHFLADKGRSPHPTGAWPSLAPAERA